VIKVISRRIFGTTAALAVGALSVGLVWAQDDANLLQAQKSQSVGPVGIAPRIQPDATAVKVADAHSTLLAKLSPVDDQMLLSPPASEWLQWRRTYNEHGFSPLSDINKDNAAGLQTAWSWSIAPATTEDTPLEHDGVLFVYGAGDHVQALDAATGDLLWEYHRLQVRPGGRQDSVHRNIALYQNLVIFGTDDRHEVALNARTGTVVWDHEFADGANFRMTAGPLVVKDKVIQGTAGCVAGGCPLIAMDAKTGNELWRFYTVAHSDQPGGNSWNGLPDDQRFGASIWITGSYDPELNLIYFGTGNSYHWQELMKGNLDPKKKRGMNRDGLYEDSTIALNPDTGKLQWYYQHLPQDYWDLDFAFEQTILTVPVNGKPQKLVCSTGKMVWTDCVDAATGKFVFSHDEGLQNIVKSYDHKTGRKTYNEQAIPDLTGQRRDLQCPAGYGDKNWPAGSFDASTGLDYTSLGEVCGESAPIMFGPNTKAYGSNEEIRIARYQPGTDGNIGRLDAVDWAGNKVVWSVRQRAVISSAVVATAGGVLFAGDMDRYFRAYDMSNGKVLWKTRLNDVVNAYPITYSVNGHQYVAVVTGCCGNGRVNNMLQLTPEIRLPRPSNSAVWVFALPDAVSR
jgi:alcohol dehydrogenase (cytochrome c)